MATVSVHTDLDAPVDQQLLDLSQPNDHSTPRGNEGISDRIPLTEISDHALKQLLVANQGPGDDFWALKGRIDTGFEYLRTVEGAMLGDEAGGDTTTMECSGENETITTPLHNQIHTRTSQRDARKSDHEMAKPKPSQAEKQAREAERLEKARVREAEKGRKDAAKKQRDEEKAKEKAKKDEQKAKKEEEKARKEEEKAKKERSQMRLGTFFIRKEPSSSPGPSRQGSIEPGVVAEKDAGSRLQTDEAQTDFDKAFAPLFLHPHTILAPSRTRSLVGREAEDVWRQVRVLDQTIATRGRRDAMGRNFARPRTRRLGAAATGPSLRELVDHCMKADKVIDLTSAKCSSASQRLKEIPVKFLKYHEDVRPPYIGSFTKMPSPLGTKLGRNPFKRAFDTVNYDYDSEAEWDDGEEGEDLESEGEEEVLDDEDEDMEDFIDDAGAAQPSPKRQKLDENQEPISTGPKLYWQEDHDSSVIPYGRGTIDMAQFEAVCLLPGVTGGIDPWSTKYWESESSIRGKVTAPETTSKDNTAMGPPSEAGNAKGLKGRAHTAAAIPAELVDEFKIFVVGKTLSKLGMIEVLKDRFPQFSKATLTKTLLQLAKREGRTEAEKRWAAL